MLNVKELHYNKRQVSIILERANQAKAWDAKLQGLQHIFTPSQPAAEGIGPFRTFPLGLKEGSFCMNEHELTKMGSCDDDDRGSAD